MPIAAFSTIIEGLRFFGLPTIEEKLWPYLPQNLVVPLLGQGSAGRHLLALFYCLGWACNARVVRVESSYGPETGIPKKVDDSMSITTNEIVSYWSLHEDESGLAVDWAEAHERCWRCANKSKLEKCHIVPASRGGEASVGNLVLLCRRCHQEAPNVPDSRFMWIWLRSTCVTFYGLYWVARGAEEFEDMFGRAPFSDPTFSPELKVEAIKLLNLEMSRATIHWGEGRLNASTIACIFALVEERFTGLQVVPPSSSAVDKRLLRKLQLLK